MQRSIGSAFARYVGYAATGGLSLLLLSPACLPCLLGCSRAAQPRADTTPVAESASPATATSPDAGLHPAPVAPDADSKWPIIVCFGDSLTAGYGVEAGASYPDDLQQRLDADGYHYRVVNAGVSGDTTKDGVLRLPRVLARKPSIAVVEFGGNDGLRGLPVSTAQSNIGTVVKALQAAGTKVVLAGITLPPDYGGQYIAQFNAMYPATARQYGVKLLPFLLEGVYGVPGSMQDDGVHPTAQGCEQVAKNVEALLKPLLRK